MANEIGWGKGVNNDIGYGAYPDNAIGAGSIYAVSNFGETLGIKDAPDDDAQAFIDAIGTLNATEQDAITDLVDSLKSDGLWTKIVAMYPIIGGTASAHKYNLKDPRDLDAAFRLSFSGSITHSSDGMLSDGTTGVADMFIIPDNEGLEVNSNHISFYSRTSDLGLSGQVFDIGCHSGSFSNIYGITVRRNTGLLVYDSGLASENRNDVANTSGEGFYIGKTNLDLTSKVYRNASLRRTEVIVDQAILGSNSVFLLGANPSFFSNKQCAFASVGLGLSDTDVANFDTIILSYQTALGRNV